MVLSANACQKMFWVSFLGQKNLCIDYYRGIAKLKEKKKRKNKEAASFEQTIK